MSINRPQNGTAAANHASPWPSLNILRYLFVAIALFATATIASAQTTVYNAVPNVLAPAYPSQPFQAQQTNEFGDYVQLAGTNRVLNSVTITMVTWAPQADPANVSYCGLFPALCSPTGWDHSFTLNIYGTPTGAANIRDVPAGPPIATVTQTKFVPWRPAEDPVNCPTKDQPGYAYKWQAVPGPADTNCFNGFAYNVTFDMSSLNQLLPNDVVVGIVYNTQTYGPSPLGVGGPFDSLNVAVPNGNVASVGTDDNTNNVFWNTETAFWYTDGGASGIDEFREDSNWTPYGTVPIRITATPNTLYVDDDGTAGPTGCGAGVAFTTINAAIAAAAAGDIVSVCPGSYPENVTVNKSLTLNGAGDGTNPLADTIVTPAGGNGVTVSSSDVSLSGLHINPQGGNYGISVAASINDLGIDNVTATNAIVGFRVGGAIVLNGLTVNDSHFDGNLMQGWYLSEETALGGNVTNVQVTNSTFNNNPNKGIYAEKLDNATFSGITVNNSGTVGTNHTAGIDLNLKWGNYSNIQILNSTITNNGTSDANGGGILIKARSTGSYSSPPATLNGVILRGLLVSGNGAGTYTSGIRIGESNNSFTGVDAGPTGVVVSYSRIINNAAHGLRNATAATNVIAENNWWGCNYGPGATGTGCSGTTNGTSGTIDANPWLTLTSSAAPDSVLINTASTVTSRLTFNNLNVDTSGGGFVPNGTPASYVATLGTVAPNPSTTTSGVTTTIFTAGGVQGFGNVATTVDGQTLNAPVAVVATLCPDVSTSVQTSLTGGVPVTIPVNVTDLTARNITSAQFTFTYNSPNPVVSSLPADISVTAGSVLPAGTIIAANTATPGIIHVSIFAAPPGPGGDQFFTGAGILVNINMKVTGAIGATMNSTLTNVKLYKINALAEHCINSVVSGSLTIISGTITGNVRYVLQTDLNGLQIEPNPGAVITATGPNPLPTPATTDGLGDYSMNGFGAGSYSITPSKAPKACGLGPFNGIGSADASAIAQHAVFLRFLTPEQKLAAKVSGIGAEPNSLDASLVARFVVCLATPGSMVGQWRFIPTGPVAVNTIAGGDYDFDSYLMGDVDGDWDDLGPARPVAVDPETAVRASLPNMTAEIGSRVTVPLRMENLRKQRVGSYEFDVEFDPEVLRPEEIAAEINGTLGEGLVVVSNSPSAGLLKVAVYGVTSVAGDGVFANLMFQTIGKVGATTPLTISGITFNDGRTPIVTAPGELTLRASNGSEISGRVVSPSGQGIRNAQVSLTRADGTVTRVTTGTFGHFSFEKLTVGESFTLSVQSRRYRFAPQQVTAVDNLAPLELIALD